MHTREGPDFFWTQERATSSIYAAPKETFTRPCNCSVTALTAPDRAQYKGPNFFWTQESNFLYLRRIKGGVYASLQLLCHTALTAPDRAQYSADDAIQYKRLAPLRSRKNGNAAIAPEGGDGLGGSRRKIFAKEGSLCHREFGAGSLCHRDSSIQHQAAATSSNLVEVCACKRCCASHSSPRSHYLCACCCDIVQACCGSGHSQLGSVSCCPHRPTLRLAIDLLFSSLQLDLPGKLCRH